MAGANTIVTVNVGGVLYTTTNFTLQKYPDSMLGALISGKFQTTRDAQGHIFIDRDGNIFRHILNFLRTSALCIPSDFTELDLLHAEADFYQIEPLVNLLNQHKEQQGSSGTTHLLEIIEVRIGSTATMPTNNSRVKTIVLGRKDAILSLPADVIGLGLSERLKYKNEVTEHSELELYGCNIRLRVGEALKTNGWKQVASNLSTSSGFDMKTMHSCLMIEHSYRDRWSLTMKDGETFAIHPDHLRVFKQEELDVEDGFGGFDSGDDVIG